MFFIKFSEQNITYCDEHLRRFIHNFDKDNDFALNLKEFSSIILPRKKENLKFSLENKKSKENVNDEIVNAFIQIIHTELTYVNQLAIISENLRNSRDLTLYEVFLLIDKNNERYLNTKNISDYLNKFMNLNDISQIDDILFRLHKSDHVKISYEDFQDLFSPIRVLENLENQKEIKKQGTNFNFNKDSSLIKQDDQIINKNELSDQSKK